jgi:starvation-inducible DNA-binding protein
MNGKAHQTREPAIKPLTNPELAVVHDSSSALNALLADLFALYMKTKNFHWHVSGPHFRDFHLLLDDQAAQILRPRT